MTGQPQHSGTRLNRSRISSLATTTGTQTQTQTDTQTPATRPILVLRAEGAETRHIQWAEDVIDNEGMGKKSSKVCCIYHKPHSANESSEEDSSSGDSDSDSEPDASKARPAGKLKARRRRQKHGHSHEHKYDENNGEGSSQRRSSPNAYERVPKYKHPVQTAPGESKV